MNQSLEIIIPLILIPILLLIYKRLRIKKLVSYDSPYLGKIEVFEKYNQELMLTTDSFIQGISIDHPSINKSYWYKIAELAVSHCQNKKAPRVLTFGLGANTTTNIISKLNPKILQTIVEFDPLIIKVCRQFFNLDRLKNLTLIEADAFKLINTKTLKKYDVIIIDIFTSKPPYLDIRSDQKEFVKKILKFLNPDGMLIFNRHGHKAEIIHQGLLQEKYLKTIFKNTKVIEVKDPRGFKNNIITASDKI